MDSTPTSRRLSTPYTPRQSISAQKYVCDSSNTELGRQRELKLRAQLTKQETTIARYKERAAHMSKTTIPLHVFGEEQQKTREARAEAEANAARCEKLIESLNEANERDESDDLLQMNMRCIARAAGNIARRSNRLPELRSTAASMVPTQIRDNALEQEYIEVLRTQRDSLYMELHDAHERIQELQTYHNSIEMQIFDREAFAEFDQDRLAKLEIAEQCARIDSERFSIHLEMSQDEILRISTLLNSLYKRYDRALCNFKAKEQSQSQERQTEVENLISAARQKEKQFQAKISQLEEELDNVAWYQEAYAQRTRQADLLTEHAMLAEQEAREYHIHSLSNHAETLQQNLDCLNAQRDNKKHIITDFNYHHEADAES
ncbi:hypothetical protein MPSI1_003552 [Malassezia psittaci]|uniref:Uncharacterized protein n=1 Tax=Malassezia psittaci TaxID=1821823 RepID=A0AAF0JFM4_9BASI|nr:hypothetical protein MPSI1_003552 [Malassezia psittaci]